MEYSLNTHTSTAATAQISMGTGGPYKHGATTTLTTGVSFKRGAFRADAQAQVSVSTNYYDNLEFGPVSGGSMGTLSNLSFRWDRWGPGDFGINLTQLAGPDWRNPNSYTAAANPFVKTDISGTDQKWTGKADFRYDLPGWKIPTTVKWGGDVSQGIRDVIRGATQNYTYLGADGRAGTGDERWPLHPNYTYRNLAGGNVNGIFTIDPWAMARDFNAHPERFIAPTPQVLLQNKLTTHWDVKEQIDFLYSQTIFKFSQKLYIAPGVRLEKTRSAGRGPADIGIAGAKEALTGNPRANIPTTTLEFIQAPYGSEAINESDSKVGFEAFAPHLA
ncbi:MAG: hypothetical protein HY736_17115 [Verrucomicrobia bacterium]|nr:hypothetical protein [Verrucomicrobiota bacterium]